MVRMKKYTFYEIIEMIKNNEIKDGEKFRIKNEKVEKITAEEYTYNSEDKDFYDEYNETLTNAFFLGDYINLSFERIEYGKIERLDAFSCNNSFEKTIVEKINEIIRKINDDTGEKE